jgi:hypothetical protein
MSPFYSIRSLRQPHVNSQHKCWCISSGFKTRQINVQEDDPIAVLEVPEDVITPPDEEAVTPVVPDPPAIVVPVIRWDINNLHNLMGHSHYNAIKRGAKYYGITLSGKPKTCVLCALATIRRKNINKVTMSKSLKTGDRLYVDISGTIWRSYEGAKY